MKGIREGIDHTRGFCILFTIPHTPNRTTNVTIISAMKELPLEVPLVPPLDLSLEPFW